MSISRHFFYYIPLAVWLCLSLIDIYGFLNRENIPIYFRAWEYVSNYTGKDAGFAVFKPMSRYSGTMTGDLLNGIGFSPKPNEIRKQEFIVDEYGYRNQPQLLDKPIDAIVLGSSFVAGGQETQENLISEILTRDYNLRTYNSPTSLQYYWDDYRFKSNTPKYIFVVGTEGEIINSLWKYIIEEKEPYNIPHKWNSYQEWKAENEQLPNTFEKWAFLFKQYSLTRFASVQLDFKLKNLMYSREEIAKQSTQNFVTYDPQSKMLFWQKDFDNPTLGTEGKKTEDIVKSAETLKKSSDQLNMRGVRLIVVALPSKTHAELETYKNIPDSQNALIILQKTLKKYEVEVIDMNEAVEEYKNTHSTPLYYPDDSHWNSDTNYLISKKIVEYLNDNTKTKNKKIKR
ncbi:MAG: hypothetical protein ABI425_00905 [Patescibacteria group bacterium]